MIKIPYVIDNERHRLADVLNAILKEHPGQSLDVATAYFNIGGFQLVQQGLEGLGGFRLLLGSEPEITASGQEPQRTTERIKADLAAATQVEKMSGTAKGLLAFLRRDAVAVRSFHRGFLHGKCYLFCEAERSITAGSFQPLVAIVGSSNLTYAGLMVNRELNVSHKAARTSEGSLEEEDPGVATVAELHLWFEQQWDRSMDIKHELVKALESRGLR